MRVQNLLLAVAATGFAALAWVGYEATQANLDLETIDHNIYKSRYISRQVGYLLLLTNDFRSDPTRRVVTQWWMNYQALNQRLREVSPARTAEAGSDANAQLSSLVEHVETIGGLFSTANEKMDDQTADVRVRRAELFRRQLDTVSEEVLEARFRWADALAAERDRRERDLQRQVVLLVGLLLFELALVMWIVARRLIRPLSRLVAAAEAVGKGNLNHRLEAAANDEFGEVARAFNEMSSQLQMQIHTLADEVAQRKRLAEEIRRSKQLMDSIVENMPLMVFVKRADDLRFELFNRAGETMLGYSRQDLIGKSDYDFFPKDQADFFTAEDRRILAIPHMQEIPQEAITTAVGEVRYLSTRKVALRNDAGEPTYLLGISEDITARKQTEDELRATNEQLVLARNAADSASQAKTDFVANMSHEIRTPMNGVLGLAQLLEETSLLPEQRQYVELIKASGKSLLLIINDILDFSKIEAGKMEFAPSEFRLHDLMQLLESIMVHNCRDKDLKLCIGLAPDVPDGLVGDKERVQQVLINIIGNAIKFTPSGEVSVFVELATLSNALDEKPDQRLVCFRIKDSGIGMTPEQQAHIFSPFAQADASTSRRFGGTGLGLSISQQLVTLMGGIIEVKSEPGKGSEFCVVLPFGVTAPQARSERPVFEQRISSDNPQRIGGLRLMLVEDNKINQVVARGMLENAGGVVTVVDNGQGAIDLLRTQPANFDVILMDVQMPIMDGMVATRLIRNELKLRLPILGMSAGVTTAERQRCIEAGMDDFIPKPVLAEQMFATLSRFVAPSSPSAPIKPPTRDVRLPTQGRAVFAIEPILKSMSGNRDFRASLVNMVQRVVDKGMVPIEEARQKWQSGQQAELAKLLHNQRGGLGTVGAELFADAAKRLETVLDTNPALPFDQAKELFFAVEDEFKAVLVAARIWLEAQAKLDSPVAVPLNLDPTNLAHLKALLIGHDMSACEFHARLKAALAVELGAARSAELDAAIARLDFAKASSLLP